MPPSTSRDASSASPSSRCRTLRAWHRTHASGWCATGRRGARPLHRRLFRPHLQALGRLDERASFAAQDRRRPDARDLQRVQLRQPARGQPALLSVDDARTLFHEFGHALHGLLSDVTYPSLAGTAVARDFVELPSQLFEHWLTVPAILERHALHAETGQPLPADEVKKLEAARTFDAGFDTVEFTASALVDLLFHRQGEAPATRWRARPRSCAASACRRRSSCATARRTSPHLLGRRLLGGLLLLHVVGGSRRRRVRGLRRGERSVRRGNRASLRENVYAAGNSDDPPRSTSVSGAAGRIRTP